MNFDEMQWLVTSESETFGPFTKSAATAYQDRLRSEGRQAVAWAAQAPDLRKVTKP